MLFRGIVRGSMMVICELNDGKLRTIYDLLKDSSVVKSYPNLFLTSSTLDMPYLVCEDAYDFSSVFELLDSDELPSDNILSQIKEAIDPILTLSIEDYQMLYIGLQDVKSYFNETKVVINIPMENYQNFKETSDLVERVKETSGDFNVKNNETLFRPNENSELFIHIPSPDSLAFAVDFKDLVPDMKSVFKPFGDELKLRTHDYKGAMRQHGMTEDQIFGDPNNNTIELYPEEKRYYESLKELHNTLMLRENEGFTLEQCVKGNLYSDLFKDYITTLIVEVLRYHRNQSGFMAMSLGENDSDDDDDDTKNVPDDSVDLFYSHGNAKLNFDGESVIKSIIGEEIKDCYSPIMFLIQALRFGSKLPSKIEVPVKERVNGELVQKGTRFFDLKTFSYSNLSGSFDSYEVAKTARGNNYSVMCAVTSKAKITDHNYASSIGFTRPNIDSPVGLILKKSFANSNEEQLVLISFIDLVNFIGIDESLTIDGISRENGVIKIDESILSDDLLSNAISLDEVLGKLEYPRFTSYVNPLMKGDFIECGSFNNNLSTLGMLRDVLRANNIKGLNVFVVVSKEDTYDKVKSYRQPPANFLINTVCYYLIDTVLRVDNAIYSLSMEKFDYSMSDLISIYSSIVSDLDYPAGVYSSLEDKKNELKGQASNNTSMRDSNVFGSQAKPEVSNPSPSNIGSTGNENNVQGGNMYNLDNLFYKGEVTDLIMVVLPTEIVNKVNLTYKELGQSFEVKSLHNTGDNTVVGFLTQVNGCYVFLEAKTYRIPAKRKFVLTKLKSNILSILRTIASGQSPKIKFDSLETLEYYCRILEKC